MSESRHIDQSTRMVWLSLRRAARPMSVNELVMHWAPVFTAVQMEDALKRLTAAGFAAKKPSNLRDCWEAVPDAPMPGYNPEGSTRTWCRTGASA
jgi:hypothetical protein